MNKIIIEEFSDGDKVIRFEQSDIPDFNCGPCTWAHALDLAKATLVNEGEAK
jgi:hypothetical protein